MPKNKESIHYKGEGAHGKALGSEEIANTLRRRIADQSILPGSRLQEARIAEEFNVSRAVAREVLGVLERRELIERIPNRGAIVTRLDRDEVYAIFDVREVLEGMCVRLATKRAPRSTWEPFVRRFGAEMKATIEAGELAEYIDALEELRAAQIQWSGNHFASSFLDLIFDKARVIARRVTILPGRAETGRVMHIEMLEKMIAGDAGGAEEIKREIIRSARLCLEKYEVFVI